MTGSQSSSFRPVTEGELEYELRTRPIVVVWYPGSEKADGRVPSAVAKHFGTKYGDEQCARLMVAQLWPGFLARVKKRVQVVLSGFYLFVRGDIVMYAPNAPDPRSRGDWLGLGVVTLARAFFAYHGHELNEDVRSPVEERAPRDVIAKLELPLLFIAARKSAHQQALDRARALLQVTASADVAAIKSAYRRRVHECHPDRIEHLGQEDLRMKRNRLMVQLAEARDLLITAASDPAAA